MANCIALIGRSGSGKDYTAQHLVDNRGFVRVAFGDQMKKLANKIFPWLPVEYDNWEDKDLPFIHPHNPNGYTPREVWLKWMNSLREVDPDIYIRSAISEAITAMGNDKDVIFTDVRFLPELKAVREIGAVTIRVVATESEHITNIEAEDNMESWTVDYIHHNSREKSVQSLYAFGDILRQENIL